jgi:hypothetical protein
VCEFECGMDVDVDANANAGEEGKEVDKEKSGDLKRDNSNENAMVLDHPVHLPVVVRACACAGEIPNTHVHLQVAVDAADDTPPPRPSSSPFPDQDYNVYTLLLVDPSLVVDC